MSLANSAVATAPRLALPPASTPPVKLAEPPPRFQLRVISLGRMLRTSVTREQGIYAVQEADRCYIAASLWSYSNGNWGIYDFNVEWSTIRVLHTF